MDREVVHKMFGDKNQKFAGSQMDRFLFTLCTKKGHFFATKGPPHEWCSTSCKILPLQLASFSLTKMQASERGRIPSYPCAGRYIEYGHDKALRQRKGGSPSQLVFRKARLWDEERTKFGKWIGKLFIRCLVTKIKKFAGSHMDRCGMWSNSSPNVNPSQISRKLTLSIGY